jgi:hypothetical protein
MSKEPMSGSKNSTTSKLLDNLDEQEKHNTSFNNGHRDLFNYDDDLTGGDPDFYDSNNQTHSNDIYDFSNVRPSLLLDTSSNNPTDDEEEGWSRKILFSLAFISIKE